MDAMVSELKKVNPPKNQGFFSTEYEHDNGKTNHLKMYVLLKIGDFPMSMLVFGGVNGVLFVITGKWPRAIW